MKKAKKKKNLVYSLYLVSGAGQGVEVGWRQESSENVQDRGHQAVTRVLEREPAGAPGEQQLYWFPQTQTSPAPAPISTEQPLVSLCLSFILCEMG